MGGMPGNTDVNAVGSGGRVPGVGGPCVSCAR
jgi:hypothetical protein